MKRTIESLTPPANKQVMWLDIPQEVKQLKAYINGEWVVVNDDTKNSEEIVNKVLEKIDKDFESYIKKEDADKVYAPKSDLEKKVDKVEGKGLSTEDFTSAEKTKLSSIAEGATRVIVDDTIKDSTNAIQNSAVKEALDGKAANSVFTASTNGLVPKADTTAEKSTAVLTAEGKWMPSYDAAKSRTKRTFLAAPSYVDGKAGFRAITAEDLPDDINVLDLMSYGISWKPNVADPIVTRVGNMSYHTTLPIQNNMRGCIAQMKGGAKIMYFLNPTDWRFREDPRGYILKDQTLVGNGDGVNYRLENDIFSTLQYEGQWLKINNVPFQVVDIDRTGSVAEATLKIDELAEEILEPGIYDVELCAVLNGYDGEVMVLVPEFWIKSWDTDTRREVRISPSKIGDTWEYQPRILIGAYHDTVLNTVPENMGYLSTLAVNSALSIANTHDYCRGGSNDETYDQYITTDRFRSMLDKPRTNMSRATMRANCRKSGKEILSYLQYKRVLYWLYVIEYANFNCQDDFADAPDGFLRVGGLGDGVSTVNGNHLGFYNKSTPLTPNGYTNEFGNGTNIKEMTMIMPTTSGGEPDASVTQYVPRWHGIENPFGDIWNTVDGVIIKPHSIVINGENYNEVYATDNARFYNDSDYSRMRVVGIECPDRGFVKEWDLGNTAEIVPRLHGGGPTQNKCDFHQAFNSVEALGKLLLGGYSASNDEGGLGYFNSYYNAGTYTTTFGFRSSCIVY